jgi:uncharacterized protein YecE (DUF72 family)
LDATINNDTAAIVQWQNAALWQRMSWVRPPLAAPILPSIVQPRSAPHTIARPSETSLPRASKPIAAAASLVPAPPNLFVGTSGWAYPTWKPGFYPADVPSRAFLNYYASKLTSVEVNYTFRALPTPAQLQAWLDATPPGFRFSFKAPQRITHFQRLRESNTTLNEFVDALSPAQAAGKLGPVLFQLPPNFTADTTRLNAFLNLRCLAKNPYLQIAFEFRNTSWFTEATYDILRTHNTALCVAESDDFFTPGITTADFRCYRLRRSGGYTSAQLTAFAKSFAAPSSETYIYFKHEDEPTGALNATAFLAKSNRASKAEARK